MPYTIGLLGAVPRLDEGGKKKSLAAIQGNPPLVVNLPPGCPFAPRCPMATAECTKEEPALFDVGVDHTAACYYTDDIAQGNLGYAGIFPVTETPADPNAEVPRDEREVVLQLDDMKKHYPLMKGAVFRRRVGTVYAVDGISLDIRQGETLGLVGESGCGKSTTIMEILNFAEPTGGEITILGKNPAKMRGRDRKALRRDIQVVFQDPMGSLDPRMPIFDIIAEPLDAHGVSKTEQERRVTELMELVGLDPSFVSRYPRQFSGGQRQRIGIARALALEPKMLVLDEPVSALDVSIQAGVINLLEELKARLGLSYLFVAHDLAVVQHIADRVAVMYLGKIVELGDVDGVFRHPAHPYTQALLSAVPIPDPAQEKTRERILLRGDLPSPANPPSGCKFRTRCPKLLTLSETDQARCLAEEPLLTIGAAGHLAACHFQDAPRSLF